MERNYFSQASEKLVYLEINTLSLKSKNIEVTAPLGVTTLLFNGVFTWATHITPSSGIAASVLETKSFEGTNHLHEALV